MLRGGFLNTSTNTAYINATANGQTFSKLTKVYNYNGFNFHQSQVSNAAFTNTATKDSAAIQAFFVSKNSFLAKFIVVGTVGGFLDIAKTGKYVPVTDPVYLSGTTTITAGATGKLASLLFASAAT